MVSVLSAAFDDVRALDVVPVEGVADARVGDVSDPGVAADACRDRDALVIAHMAPNRPGVYDEPALPFDVNVKGAALLFDQALRCGVRRVVLISSMGVVRGRDRSDRFLHSEHPMQTRGLYGLTKICQEMIAEHYHRNHGLPVAVLRPAYIVDADSGEDKYGRKLKEANWQFTDRRDIAGATVAALRKPDLEYGVYPVMSHPAATEYTDIGRTYHELGWRPQYMVDGPRGGR